jgi:hypothetical protein
VPLEAFANLANTTVTSGGTDAPSAGTVETWTVASSSAFPDVSVTFPPTQCHVTDIAANSEIILVTNISGTTWTVTRGAEGTTPVAHNPGFEIYQVTTAGWQNTQSALPGASLDWINAAARYGADPTGTNDSTTAIQDALNAAGPGQVVYLPAGTYETLAPLNIPPGVTLAGDSAILGDASGDTIPASWIAPGPAFSGGYVLGIQDAHLLSYSDQAANAQILSLSVNGADTTAANLNGILLRGPVNGITLSNVYVANITGSGLNCSTDTYYTQSAPYRVRVSHFTSSNCAGEGFNLQNLQDSTLTDCLSTGCGSADQYSGYYLYESAGIILTACRSELSAGYGFTVQSTASSAGKATAGGVTFTGCMTDSNYKTGFDLNGTGTGPVSLTGCVARRDGTDYTSAHAGIRVDGATYPVTITGCQTIPGTADSGSGNVTPKTGLTLSAIANVLVDNSVLWGYLTAVSWDSSGTYSAVNCLGVTGTIASPAVTPIGLPVTGLAPSGDTSGATDTANIQGLLGLAGDVSLGAGEFWIKETLLLSSGTTLAGQGMGITTIKACSGYAATQVGSNPGMIMIGTTGNGSTAQSNITLASLTVDMNEANVGYPLPGYASQNECSPVAFTGVNGLTVHDVQIINSVGYALLPRACTDISLRDNVITTGQAVVHNYVTQDAIHVIDCTGGVIKGNILNTGDLYYEDTNVGDDCICIQGVSTGSSGITITGNVILASGARGITLVLGGSTVSGITVTGNYVSNTQSCGFLLEYGIYESSSTYYISNVACSGNVFYNLALSGAGRGIQMDDATNVSGGHTGIGWRDVSISNNSLVGMTNTGGQGIYVQSGNGLAISGNTFDQYDVNAGIQIGDYLSDASVTVKNYQVTGNMVNLSASTYASGAAGIFVIDSPGGVIANNTCYGNEALEPATSSAGIAVLAIGTAVTGMAVTGNRCTEWDTGIVEANGGAAPDYNCYTSNNLHNCTAFITTVGSHDVVASNVVA